MSATVTRRNRELALAAIFKVDADELARAKNTAAAWAENGIDESIPWTDELPRVAQALADIEAQALASRPPAITQLDAAWLQGAHWLLATLPGSLNQVVPFHCASGKRISWLAVDDDKRCCIFHENVLNRDAESARNDWATASRATESAEREHLEEGARLLRLTQLGVKLEGDRELKCWLAVDRKLEAERARRSKQ